MTLDAVNQNGRSPHPTTERARIDRAAQFRGLLREWTGDWGGLLVIGLCVYVALFVSWLFLRWAGSDQVSLIDNLAFLPVGLAASVLALRAGLRGDLDERARRAWKIVSLAFCAFWVGDVLWLYYENILGSVPFPSFADVGYLAFYPLLFLGLMAFPAAPRRGEQVMKFWLDSMTVLLGSGMIIWHVLLRPIAAAEDSTSLLTTLSLAYPVGDLVLLSGITALVLRGPKSGSRGALLILAMGVLLFVVADVSFGSLSIQEKYATGDWPDAVWIVGQLLWAISAQYQCRASLQRVEDGQRDRPGGMLSTALTACAVILAFGFVVISAGAQLAAPVAGLLIAALVLTSLVLARQISMFSENSQLLVRANKLAGDLTRSEARFRSLVQHASDAIVVVSGDGKILYESAAVERVLGYTPQQRIGTNALETVHPDDAPGANEVINQLIEYPGDCRTLEFRARHSDGGWRWLEVTVTNRLEDPNVQGIIGNYRNITERKRLEELLAYRATHDALTTLPNRALFKDRLEHALARSRRQSESLAVMFIDLDNFKNVNDSLGHTAGDELLAAMAKRLKDCLRESDTAARLGGDEFAVLLEGASESDAGATAARILEALSLTFRISGNELSARASIGVAVRREDSTAEELLRGADVAMYGAKGKGKGCYEMFDPEGAAKAGSARRLPRSA